jgi:hypothetical protein
MQWSFSTMTHCFAACSMQWRHPACSSIESSSARKIQIISQDPYSTTHIMNIAVRILMQSGIFPIKDFEIWVAMPNKMYPLLKTFIHEVYTCRLTAIFIQNTDGQLGYVANQNMFNILNNDAFNMDTDNDATAVTQTWWRPPLEAHLAARMLPPCRQHYHLK